MAQQTPKMKRLIKNYRGYTFESSCFTTKEYKSFQTKYINVLKDMATNLNAVLTVNKNHFCFSAFFEQKETGEVVYMSVSDVRSFQDEWLTNVMYRTAKDTKDYRGGQNNWTDLEHLEGAISQMMQREYARKNQSRNEEHVTSTDYAA